MIEINNDFLAQLFHQAEGNERLRQNFDLRTSGEDTSQRMLNALLLGTEVPIHRHEDTTETVVCLCGKMDEVIYRQATHDEAMEEGRLPQGMNGELPRSMDAQDVMRPQQCFVEVQRIRLCPAEGKYGCQVPKGAWHTVEVIEPSVIFEAKDGNYSAPL